MEKIIIIFLFLVLFGIWRIYRKITEIGVDLDIELKGLNQKMVTLLMLQDNEFIKK